MVSSVRSLSLNSATQESGKQESTCQVVCLLLMTKPFGLFIWTVLQDPDGLLILIYIVTLAVNFLYPSFILHVLEIENVTARNDNLILNSRSVYYSGLQPGLFVQECLYLLYSY